MRIIPQRMQSARLTKPMGRLTKRDPETGPGLGVSVEVNVTANAKAEAVRDLKHQPEPPVEGKLVTPLRRPASRMVSVARRIVVEREGIKLAIQDIRTVDARMHG